MTFAAPIWLAALAIVPLLWLAWRHRARQRLRAAALFRSDFRTARPHRSAYRLAVTAFAVLSVVALMQPQWGTRAEDAPRSGRDIFVLLDTSLSMLAEDVAPNRLDLARRTVRQLADAVGTEGGHRISLIVFSGRPMLQSPLTLDYDLFRERLADVHVGMIDTEGSALADTISFAVDRSAKLQPGHVDMILVTDGEDHPGLVRGAAREAAQSGATLYTLAIGAPGDGALIPVPGEDGKRAVLEFDGFPVRSRIDERLLRDAASNGGGSYLGATGDPDVLATLFRDVLANKPRRELDQVSAEVPAHRFQWFLIVAILALLAEPGGIALLGRART